MVNILLLFFLAIFQIKSIGTAQAQPKDGPLENSPSAAMKRNVLQKEKVDVDGGSSNGQLLRGAQIPTMPTDTPGASGTSIPNTLWVDTHFTPKIWFITTNTTWTVCPSGCNYASPLDAWHAALSANFLNGALLTIKISNGRYDLTDQLFTNTQKTKNVKVIGNTADPFRVVLNFTHTRGTNLGGFTAYNGGQIGLIDGVTIQAPDDGSGSVASTDSLRRHAWNAQSYGSGIEAYGSGSNISIGGHVIIRNFYYSLVADNNGGIDAPNGGVTMSTAGDVNAMARGGGVIVCTPCSATDASDYTNPNIAVLGANYDAERGGSLYIDGSTGSKSLVNGIVGLTGGNIWAHHVVLTGGLNSSGNGVGAWENSSIELAGATIRGYATGIDARQGAFVSVDNVTVSANSGDGIRIDGGRVEGGNVISRNNGGYGINTFHQGVGHFYHTRANLTGNTQGVAVVEAPGTSNEYAYQGSSLVLQ